MRNPWLLWGCVIVAIAEAKGLDWRELFKEAKRG